MNNNFQCSWKGQTICLWNEPTLHTFTRLKSVCFSFWTPHLSYSYSPRKGRVVKTHKQFWKLTSLTRRKLKDKIPFRVRFPTLRCDRDLLWFLSLWRDNTRLITLLTHRSLKTERMTTACYCKRSMVTITHNLGHFWATGKRRPFFSSGDDLVQVSYFCTCHL